MPDSINVALIGRNALTREGLCRILAEQGFDVRASAARPSDLRSSADSLRGLENCLVVVDVGMNGCEPEMIDTIQALVAGARIVLLADEFDFDTMLTAFRQGASGYIVKEITPLPLIASLKLAATGEKVLPSQLAEQLPAHAPTAASDAVQKTIDSAQLSDRETEILRCLIMGCPNKIISRVLDISEATVKVHVKAILRKVRVHNRTQAAIWAVNRGLEGITLNAQQMGPWLESEAIEFTAVTPQVFAHESLPQLAIAAH